MKSKLQSVARKARAKKLRFAQLKKKTTGELRALIRVIKSHESSLKERAKKVSLAIERFNAIAEEGTSFIADSTLSGNPHLENDIEISTDAIESVLEEHLAVLK
jgi:hypothetical protein